MRLFTTGFLQFLSPTLQFLLAVLAFGERFSTTQMLCFGCIWAAVLIYALDSLSAARGYRIQILEPDRWTMPFVLKAPVFTFSAWMQKVVGSEMAVLGRNS